MNAFQLLWLPALRLPQWLPATGRAWLLRLLLMRDPHAALLSARDARLHRRWEKAAALDAAALATSRGFAPKLPPSGGRSFSSTTSMVSLASMRPAGGSSSLPLVRSRAAMMELRLA